jgi:hypothetical protein
MYAASTGPQPTLSSHLSQALLMKISILDKLSRHAQDSHPILGNCCVFRRQISLLRLYLAEKRVITTASLLVHLPALGTKFPQSLGNFLFLAALGHGLLQVVPRLHKMLVAFVQQRLELSDLIEGSGI